MSPRASAPLIRLSARWTSSSEGDACCGWVRGTSLPVTVIPSGSISLDAALGVGGFPRGRVMEIFGPESSGKTTLALHVIAQSQKVGGTAAFIDAEHALGSYVRPQAGRGCGQPDRFAAGLRGAGARDYLRARIFGGVSTSSWWIRWRRWCRKRNSKAKWAIATWDCTPA